MAEYWFTSDTHFGHANVLTFLDTKGMLVRPGFSSIEEMNEHIIEKWNSVVKPEDKIYHLGDVTFNYKDFAYNIAPRLNGRKRLVLGNHDALQGEKAELLFTQFERVIFWQKLVKHDLVLSHMPLNDETFEFRHKGMRNVHGHLHEKSIMSANHACVCVERTGYTPVHIDELNSYFGK
jgi:calcineurin-like phosphoesterase family protein